MEDLVQVVTTVGSKDEADKIAGALVERRLAACVQLLGPIQSIYRWQAKIETSQEWMCMIKTTRARYAAVEEAIRQLHSYAVPEILAMPVERASQDYCRWLENEVKADGD